MSQIQGQMEQMQLWLLDLALCLEDKECMQMHGTKHEVAIEWVSGFFRKEYGS